MQVSILVNMSGRYGSRHTYLNDFVMKSQACSLGTVACPQLGENIADMKPDRPYAKSKPLGDLLVSLASDNKD